MDADRVQTHTRVVSPSRTNRSVNISLARDHRNDATFLAVSIIPSVSAIRFAFARAQPEFFFRAPEKFSFVYGNTIKITNEINLTNLTKLGEFRIVRR